MGEAKRKLSATQRLISQFPDCCLCGGLRPSTTREHMPPRSLFDKSHRPDEFVMPACGECNRTTSTADLVVSLVSRWDFSSTQQENVDHSRLVARLRMQAPELIAEWTAPDVEEARKARLHLLSQGVPVPACAAMNAIGELTILQLNLFAHKAVLALHFHHFRHPLSNAGRVCAFWRTKEDARDGIPAVFLEMLPGYATITQGQWSEQDTFDYRFNLNEAEGLLGCFARFRRFFVFGFTVSDAACLPPDDLDWIRPSDLASILVNARFLKKH
jgi:hypothetical protein